MIVEGSKTQESLLIENGEKFRKIEILEEKIQKQKEKIEELEKKVEL